MRQKLESQMDGGPILSGCNQPPEEPSSLSKNKNAKPHDNKQRRITLSIPRHSDQAECAEHEREEDAIHPVQAGR